MSPIGTNIEDAWIPGAEQANLIYNEGLPALDPNNYLQNTMAALNGPNPYTSQLGGFNANNPALQQFDQFMPGNTNPYADQLFNLGADSIQDRLNSQFGASGQGSSSGNLVNQARDLGAWNAKYYGGIYDADMNRALEATQGKSNAYLDASRQRLDALGQAQTGQQASTNAAATFLPGIQQQIQNEPWNNLQQYSNIVGQLTGSSPQSNDPKSSGWDKLIGIGTIAAAFMSDRRTKENVELVGWHKPTGLNVYHFNYLGSPRRFEGFMADEVERIRPDAVTVGDDGYQRVFYDRLDFEMTEIH